MAKTYTKLGVYKKPSKEQIEKYPGQVQRSFISVYFGKNGPEFITMRQGDIISITKKSDKMNEINEALATGKMKQDTYDYFAELYSDEDVIGEALLVQK